ncbi:MAG: hypothetical protein PQJ46_05055 [Spirochaetales bacterium]|nr:hypothetical protein [Spirochaetales bacterium]
MKNKISIFFIVSIFTLFSTTQVFSQYEIKTNTEISWATDVITIEATVDLPDDVTNITSERFKITEFIDRKLTNIAMSAFNDIYLDSLTTLGDFFSSSMQGLTDFDQINIDKNHISSSMSLNLDSVTNYYKYDINKEIIPLIITHKKGAPIPEELNYEPSANFSGIIIYAKDELPYYGEQGRKLLKPAIFPKLYTEKMDQVVTYKMADPEFLSKWGFVQYTYDLNELKYEERIGRYPFRTTAEGIFGNNCTDILITEEAARKLLYNPANRRLIKEGRILIIINKEENPKQENSIKKIATSSVN